MRKNVHKSTIIAQELKMYKLSLQAHACLHVCLMYVCNVKSNNNLAFNVDQRNTISAEKIQHASFMKKNDFCYLLKTYAVKCQSRRLNTYIGLII